VTGGGELRHVEADLGDDGLGGETPDASHLVEALGNPEQPGVGPADLTGLEV